MEYDLTIARQEMNFTGQPVKAMTINGLLPRGLFGALVIEPKDQGECDGLRDHVVVLSDWTDEDASSVLHTLKRGDVVRFILIYRTMMHHPMHLHGHFGNIGKSARVTATSWPSTFP